MAHLDFNQIGAHDYSQYLQTVRALDLGATAEQRAFRRVVFNVAAANCDDHTKNFSFTLPRNGRWALAPAYDVTHAHSPTGAWTFQHLMSVNGKFANITKTDLLELADRYAIADATAVLKEVAAAVDSWSEYASLAGVPPATHAAIASDLAAFEIR